MALPDAFLEEDIAPLAVPEKLRATVPAPAAIPADMETLEREAVGHRILILRGGAVIAVTTLVAIVGALVLHALVAGVFVVSIFFPWKHSVGSPIGDADGGADDQAGGGGGYMMLGTGPDDNAPPSLRPIDVLGRAPDAAAIIGPTPALPPLPEATAVEMAQARLAMAAPVVISPAPEDLGTLHVAPNVPAAVAFVPPSGSTVGKPGDPTRGTSAADGGGTEDEPKIGYLKGDGSGGAGRGSGRANGAGRGTGIDRGLSAADRPPQPLDIGLGGFELPFKYSVHPPEKSVELTVTVLPDGTLGEVKIEQSCGIAEVDEMVRQAASISLRFLPAIKGGKAVTSVVHYEVPFGKSF